MNRKSILLQLVAALCLAATACNPAKEAEKPATMDTLVITTPFDESGEQTPNVYEEFGFVALTDVVPDVIIEARYFGTYNFVGSRIDGYLEPTALITRQAADSLKAVSDDVIAMGYRLKVYDAYRPQMAVDHFMRWGAALDDTLMRPFFYPYVDKSRLFELGYIAEKSGHSRGSTVDLTLFDMATGKELDMGGVHDWFGIESHPDYCGNISSRKPNKGNGHWQLSEQQFKNRMILRDAMLRHGFEPYDCEWWHFTLKNEPYPNKYFNFPVKTM